MSSVAGRHAAITGASSGIGRPALITSMMDRMVRRARQARGLPAS